MTTIYYEADGAFTALEGQTVAVVGYGNQGRSWALNLRDSGLEPIVCVRRDATREQAEEEGFVAHDVKSADDADVVRWLPVFSLRPLEEVAALADATRERPAAREAQRALAAESWPIDRSLRVRVAVHTGESCIPCAGHATGRHVSAQANMRRKCSGSVCLPPCCKQWLMAIPRQVEWQRRHSSMHARISADRFCMLMSPFWTAPM